MWCDVAIACTFVLIIPLKMETVELYYRGARERLCARWGCTHVRVHVEHLRREECYVRERERERVCVCVCVYLKKT